MFSLVALLPDPVLVMRTMLVVAVRGGCQRLVPPSPRGVGAAAEAGGTPCVIIRRTWQRVDLKRA